MAAKGDEKEQEGIDQIKEEKLPVDTGSSSNQEVVLPLGKCESDSLKNSRAVGLSLKKVQSSPNEVRSSRMHSKKEQITHVQAII